MAESSIGDESTKTMPFPLMYGYEPLTPHLVRKRVGVGIKRHLKRAGSLHFYVFAPLRFGTPSTQIRYVGLFCIVVTILLAAQLLNWRRKKAGPLARSRKKAGPLPMHPCRPHQLRVRICLTTGWLHVGWLHVSVGRMRPRSRHTLS